RGRTGASGTAPACGDAGAAAGPPAWKSSAKTDRHNTGAPDVAEARIGAGEEAARAAAQRGGVAVAAGMTPAAEPERPEGEIARSVVGAGRGLHRIIRGVRVFPRIGQLRTGKGERAQSAASAAISHLSHAAEHAAARELRLLGLRVVHATEDLAGERIKGLPGAIGGLVEHRKHNRIGRRVRVKNVCNRHLISSLGSRGKQVASAAASTSTSVV